MSDERDATIRLLEEENARLKTELGAALYVGGERTRSSIARWLRCKAVDDPELFASYLSAASSIESCEDIDPP